MTGCAALPHVRNLETGGHSSARRFDGVSSLPLTLPAPCRRGFFRSQFGRCTMSLPPEMPPISRPAKAYADLNATFHHFDAHRFRWLAHYLREAGRPAIAESAERWAEEHKRIAADLMRNR